MTRAILRWPKLFDGRVFLEAPLSNDGSRGWGGGYSSNMAGGGHGAGITNHSGGGVGWVSWEYGRGTGIGDGRGDGPVAGDVV